MEGQKTQTSALRKLVTAAGLISSIGVIVLSVLFLFDVWDSAPLIYVPLMCVNLACQAYTQWKPNRKIAWFSLIAAAFLVICYIAVILLK